MKHRFNGEGVSQPGLPDRPRILVVDDDEGARRTMTLILERRGFEVVRAATAREALEKADNGCFNVGLLDVRLPDGKGVELLTPLKERHPDMALIMVTGYASTETAVHALNEGATAYITKPVNVDAVLAEIEKILERQRLIAENREAERRLRQSEERYRSLFEGVPVALYRTTPAGRILDVNPALVEMLGYPDRETLIEREVEDGFLDHGVRAQWQSLMEQKGVVRRFEARFRRFDGEPIWVLDSARAVRDAEGRVAYYEGSLVDITERRRAERALRESEARYRTLFNSASDAIFIHDLEGRFLEVNDVASERLGYGREALLQMGPRDIEAREYAGRFETRMRELRKHGHIYLETVHKRRNGTSVPTELSSRIIEYDGGEAVLAIARDITEREELERRLRRQERLATLGRLVGGVAHDTNNALMSIVLCAELLQRSPSLPEALAQDVETIMYEADEAAEIMQQVLDFTRQSPLEARIIDLKSLIDETLHVLRRILPESIDIVWRPPADEYVLQADPSRIHQVIMNLAINARDAMPQGGELQIALSRLRLTGRDEAPVSAMDEGEWISLTVADTGMGISDEALEHLFEPFFTTKVEGEGTGLGLAQVYGIVEQHEGHIAVETVEGRGTRFEVYLPAHASPLPGEVTADDVASVPRGGGETVLVVEDERGVREACCRTLEALGYRALPAEDGVEGLEIMKSGEAVDLVLTDIVMPNMDGLDFMEELASLAPDLPVLVMTGYVLDERVTRIRENEYVPLLHKPVDRRSLGEIVYVGLHLRGHGSGSRAPRDEG